MHRLYTPGVGAVSGVHVGCDLLRQTRRGSPRDYQRATGTDFFYVTSSFLIEVVLYWCSECWVRYKGPLGVCCTGLQRRTCG
jgi:hypothetical protein